MRISYRENNCPHIHCFGSQFCCNLLSFLRPRKPKNVPSSSNATTNPNSISNSNLVSVALEETCAEEKLDALSVNNEEEVLNLKSSLKRPNGKGCDLNLEKKGNVKWMDLIGKELVEVKEFEPSECGDTLDDMDGNSACVCNIQ